MAIGYARQPDGRISLFLEVVLLMVMIHGTFASDSDDDDDKVALTPDGKVDKSYILSGADQEHQSPTTNWVFLILQPLLWTCCCLAAYVQQKRRSALIGTRNIMVERRRQQREGDGDEEEDFDEDARLALVMAKFHIHQVPSSSAEKTVDEEDDDGDEESPKDTEDDERDDDKIIIAKGEETEAVAADDDEAHRLSSIWNNSFVKNKEQAECSICLEGYCQPEKVCVSKNPECSHVFHQECIAEWLKRHDKCPLCRVDLLK